MGIGRKFVTFAAVVGLTVIGGGFASATGPGVGDQTATHTVSFTVSPTRTITLSETSTVSLGSVGTTGNITGVSGGNLLYKTDATSGAKDKVAVSVGTGWPSNVAVEVSAGAVTSPSCSYASGTGGQSDVSITTTPATVVAGIYACGSGTDTTALTYDVVTTGASLGAVSKVVTYTLTSE